MWGHLRAWPGPGGETYVAPARAKRPRAVVLWAPAEADTAPAQRDALARALEGARALLA